MVKFFYRARPSRKWLWRWARDWLGAQHAAISDLEILQPMIFPANASREILCRATPMTGAIEIMSRPRLSNTPYVLHAKAKLIQKQGQLAPTPAIPQPYGKTVSGG